MEFILDNYMKEKYHTIEDGVLKCTWVPSKTVRINNAEFYNVIGIEINPKNSCITLLYSLKGPIITPVEFLSFEVRVEYKKDTKTVQIYT